jgi:hypothetical protein
MENYKYNIFPTLTNGFATASDFMILFLTVNRFKILKNIECLENPSLAKWVIRYELVLCGGFCFFCHLPYLFSYDILECRDLQANVTISDRYEAIFPCFLL